MNPANIRLLRRQISCLFNRYELNQLVLDQETISKIKKLAEKLAAEHESYFNEEFNEKDIEENVKISEYTLKMKRLLQFISSAKDVSKVKISIFYFFWLNSMAGCFHSLAILYRNKKKIIKLIIHH